MIFPTGGVPIKVAARVYGKDPAWVRAGIVAGWLPIGKAVRDGEEVDTISSIDIRKGRISYYISPKLLFEHTGYVWKGEKK